jgi:superfamily I DNA/RNA helicase
MATLALSKEMLTQYAKLPRPAQAKVAQLADKFRQMSAVDLRGSKGIHLEQHTGQRDPHARTIRIDDNHRGIVYDAGNDDLFVLTHIDSHDNTDHWMANNVFRVNEATGAFEIIDLVAVEEAAERLAAPEPAHENLFSHRKAKDFSQLGVNADLVPALQALTDQDQLQGLLSVLPAAQADALILLTTDDSVEAIYREIAGSIVPAEIDPKDVAAAINTPASKAQFTVVSSEDELQEMLAKPLALWRTYLHPSQRDAVNRHYSGPARVTGGAGTGKTVVAIHRAARLAYDTEVRAGKPILFTTFTRNLAQAIERDLRELGGSDTIETVDVINVDRLSYRIVSDEEGTRPDIVEGDGLMRLWADVVDERGLEYSPEFLHNEWEQVVLAQDCRSRDDYFTASRAGRGIPLDRRKRADVWRAIESLNRKLVDSGRRTYLQLAAAAAGYIQARSVKPYQHVIVDEAQDLHEAQWRLLRAAVPEQPDDMFIVGDSHQRIYDRRASLGKVGIHIVGRSKKLRINYRTTHEILAWSLSLLGEGKYDDLDDGVDTHDFAGYHSLSHGPRPTVFGGKSAKEQLDALGAQVRSWVEQGVDGEAIGVTARANPSLDAIELALRNAGIPSTRLGQTVPADLGVRIGTMHRFKGLEFRCVAVVNCDDDGVPAHWDLTDRNADPVQHSIDLQRERCLLYVACTRAREDLWVGWSGKPSRFLAAVAEGGSS